MNSKQQSGFTLIELLIVIAILAILTVIVLLLINPSELQKEARDSQRLSDIDALDTAVGIASLRGLDLNGPQSSNSLVYVSLPDDGTDNNGDSEYDDCDELGLPSLPSGWDYRCRTAADYRRADGYGWIPVNFLSLAENSISTLPVDPMNDVASGQYYTYAIGSSWQFTAHMESAKQTSTQANDGGPDPAQYEKGSSLGITPFVRGMIAYWNFEEQSGDTAVDKSGYGRNGTMQNGAHRASGKIGSALELDGSNDYVSISPVYLPNFDNFSLAGWFYLTGNATGDYYPIFGNNQCPPMLGYHKSNGDFVHLKQWVENGGSSETPYWETDIDISGSWHHAALVVGPGVNSVELFLDGVSKGKKTMTTNGYTHSNGQLDKLGAKYLGPGSCSVFFWEGKLDEMRVWRRTLSAHEIKSIYESTK